MIYLAFINLEMFARISSFLNWTSPSMFLYADMYLELSSAGLLDDEWVKIHSRKQSAYAEYK